MRRILILSFLFLLSILPLTAGSLLCDEMGQEAETAGVGPAATKTPATEMVLAKKFEQATVYFTELQNNPEQVSSTACLL